MNDKRSHRPQLDALRTFAVFAVMLGHFAPTATEAWPLGQLGVRLFFVLSGFLITGILLDCRRLISDGAAAAGVMRRFYARRFLRLIPAYYALLLVMWVAGSPEVRDTLPWHLAYLSNVYFSWLGTWHRETSHFWSLAVEEQFYLLWPVVVLFQPPRRTTIVVLLIALSAPLFRTVGMWQGWTSVTMTVLPFASTDSLGIGALLALWSATDAAARARLSRICGWLSLLAIVLTMMKVLNVNAGRAVRDVWIGTVWSLSFVWLVDRAAQGFRGGIGRALENRAILYLGRTSYGLYLFHAVSPRLLRALWSFAGINAPYPPNALIGVGGPMLLTIGLASLSWRVYEGPLNGLKRYLPYGPEPSHVVSVEADTTGSGGYVPIKSS